MVNNVVVLKIVIVVEIPTILKLKIFVRLDKQTFLEQLLKMLGKVLFFCSNMTVLKVVERGSKESCNILEVHNKDKVKSLRTGTRMMLLMLF